MGMWTLYNLKLGSFHELTDSEAEEAKQFYYLWRNHLNLWQNNRGDIYMWEN